MAIQSAAAANGSYASLGPFPVRHCCDSVVSTEANTYLNRVIGQERHMCWLLSYGVCVRVSILTHRKLNIKKIHHLLAGKELSLVLVDDGVTCGYFTILVPSNWTQEVSWVGKTIGSWESHKHIHTNTHTHTKTSKSA